MVRSTLFDTAKSVPPLFNYLYNSIEDMVTAKTSNGALGFEKVKKFGQHCSTLRNQNQHLPLFDYLYNSIEDILSAKTSNLELRKSEKSSANTVRHFEVSKISTVSFYLLDSRAYCRPKHRTWHGRKSEKFGQHCSTLWNQYLFELFIQLNRRYSVGQNI